MGNSEILMGKTSYSTIESSLTDKYIYLGQVWRIDSGYLSIAADTNYWSFNFTTPSTGYCIYSFAEVAKTGAELVKSLIEGGTYSGGSTITPRNVSRIVGDSNCPFSVVGGLSTASATVTGGTEFGVVLIPGSSQGNNSAPSSSVSPAYTILKPATNYTFKLLGKGVATFSTTVDLAYIPA